MSVVEKYSQQLKSCPFCGGKVELTQVSYGGSSNYDCGHRVVIKCKSCGVEMRGKDTSWMSLESCEPQVKDVTEKWNRRA